MSTESVNDPGLAGRPRPTVSDFNRPFWEGTRVHEFRVQRCRDCGKSWAPASPVCPGCLSEAFDWVPTAGRGTVVSWVIFHKLYHPAFAEDLPYNVALVELEEGPRVIANVVGIDNAALRDGLPVEVVFDRVDDELTLPRFRPSGR